MNISKALAELRQEWERLEKAYLWNVCRLASTAFDSVRLISCFALLY